MRGCHRACRHVSGVHDSGNAAATGASLLSGQSEVEWLMDVPLKTLGPSCVCVYVRAFSLPVVAAGTGSNEAAAACGVMPRRDWDERASIQSFYHLYCLGSSVECLVDPCCRCSCMYFYNSELMLKILLVFVIWRLSDGMNSVVVYIGVCSAL